MKEGDAFDCIKMQDYIINNFVDEAQLKDDLFEAMYESYGSYIEDLKYENTFEKELKENNCENEGYR